MKGHFENIVKSSEVIGVNVINIEKSNIGKIEELVLDKVSGEIRYVVLSFGGMFGFGDKYFAFPWRSISYSKPDKAFLLNVDKNLLKEENGFDKDHWPEMALWEESFENLYNT